MTLHEFNLLLSLNRKRIADRNHQESHFVAVFFFSFAQKPPAGWMMIIIYRVCVCAVEIAMRILWRLLGKVTSFMPLLLLLTVDVKIIIHMMVCCCSHNWIQFYVLCSFVLLVVATVCSAFSVRLVTQHAIGGLMAAVCLYDKWDARCANWIFAYSFFFSFWALFICLHSILTMYKSMILSFASILGAVDGAHSVIDGNELAPLWCNSSKRNTKLTYCQIDLDHREQSLLFYQIFKWKSFNWMGIHFQIYILFYLVSPQCRMPYKYGFFLLKKSEKWWMQKWQFYSILRHCSTFVCWIFYQHVL